MDPLSIAERLDNSRLDTHPCGGLVSVSYAGYDQVVCVTDESGVSSLLDLVEEERDRCLKEILEDFEGMPGIGLSDITDFGMLHDYVDANIYPAGGRSEGEFGDEVRRWSEVKTDDHSRYLLSKGIIGLGTGEMIDPGELGGSAAFAGFLNAVMTAVDHEIRRGWLIHHSPKKGLGPS